MKRITILLAALFASVLPCRAAETAYNQALVNQVVAATTTFTIDLNAYGIDAMSFQATLSSASPQVQTFKDGTPSTGTITVVNTSLLTVAPSSDTIVITTNSALSPTKGSISVNVSTASFLATGGIIGSTVAINGVKLLGGTDFLVGASTNATAINLAAAINNKVPNVSAAVVPVSGGTVTITCVQAGSFCNTYTITSSTVAISTAAGTTFTGGNDNASFNLNGIIFPQGGAWSQQDTSSNTAISIKNAVNALSAFTASTNSASSVLIALVSPGSYGNAYTLTSSTGALKVLSVKLVGGQDNAFLNINGRILTQGSQWSVIGSSVQVSTAIAAAINADPVLSLIMQATAQTACPNSCGVVFTTGAINTTGNNYAWYSSTSGVTVSNSGLYGGTTSAYSLNSPLIAIPSHGYATGEAVKFSTGTVILQPLSNQTTYYVIAVDANNIELAVTSTSSLAGSFITLTSTSIAGPHTFTLTPLSLVGNIPLTWSVSNDGTNFVTPTVTASNVTIPINTLASPWAATSYAYDFGNIGYRYLRLTIAGPSTVGNGGINALVTGYGKRFWR